VVPADGTEIAVASLSIRHPGPGEAGPILVDHVLLYTADADYRLLAAGAVFDRLSIRDDETILGEATGFDDVDPSIRIPLSPTILLTPGTRRDLLLHAELRTTPTASAFRLGCNRDALGLSPETVLLGTADDSPFPVWTEIASLAPPDLKQSWSNFPNPFSAGREVTRFAYYLPVAGTVSLRLLDPRGETVRILLEEVGRSSGLYDSDAWDGRNGQGTLVRAGVYVAELQVALEGGERLRLLRKVAVVR
jgi:hypothetical protein